jgi:hypothetical protein
MWPLPLLLLFIYPLSLARSSARSGQTDIKIHGAEPNILSVEPLMLRSQRVCMFLWLADERLGQWCNMPSAAAAIACLSCHGRIPRRNLRETDAKMFCATKWIDVYAQAKLDFHLSPTLTHMKRCIKNFLQHSGRTHPPRIFSSHFTNTNSGLALSSMIFVIFCALKLLFLLE